MRGLNKMHQGGKLSRFLKMGEGVFLGHSVIIIKLTWEIFFRKFAIWPSPFLQLGTIGRALSNKYGISLLSLFWMKKAMRKKFLEIENIE